MYKNNYLNNSIYFERIFMNQIEKVRSVSRNQNKSKRQSLKYFGNLDG